MLLGLKPFWFSVSCIMSDKKGAPSKPPLTGGGGNKEGNNAPQQSVSFQQVFANVISSANVPQFVLASQVPGLSQVYTCLLNKLKIKNKFKKYFSKL